jgi:hypothetical protein
VVLRAVVEHVAALAEGTQVTGPRVARIVVEMGGSERHASLLEVAVLVVAWPGDFPAPAVPPSLVYLVKPAAVAKVMHDLPMWAAADLAASLGADEAHPGRELRPIDRVEVAELFTDRHLARFKAGGNGTLANDFVRFLVEEGWLAY